MKLKNIVKTTSSLLLALMTVMGISMTAFAADSSVTFKDGKLSGELGPHKIITYKFMA